MSLVTRMVGPQQGALQMFPSALYLWALGDITRTQVINAFQLTAAEDAQLDQLQTQFTGLTNLQKVEFYIRFDSATRLYVNGLMTSSQYKTLLSLT